MEIIVCIKFMPIKRRVSATKSHKDKQRRPLQMQRITNGPKKADDDDDARRIHQNLARIILRRPSSCVLYLFSYLFLLTIILTSQHNFAQASERMVRLCIASVDPVKLSSQCVMCNRREFPLTVIDCTGITKVNDLIANPLSVQEATCLIYNCRRQVPDVKPEPYHGSVSHAANYRPSSSSSSSSNGYSPFGPSATGSRNYEMMTPSGMFGGGYSAMSQMQPSPQMPLNAMYMSRYGGGPNVAGYGGATLASMYPPASMAMSPLIPKGLIGGPRGIPDRQQGPLPYALVPASSFPFGSRKYKMALMPLFK